MAQLAKENKVLFASSPSYIRDIFKHSRTQTRESARISDNLYTYVPPRWLPVNYRFPALERRMKAYRRQHLRATMSRLGMKQPILYIWHPSFADMVGSFDE